jgi:hypothetical protein
MVTAKDAKGNLASAMVTVTYTPGNLALWKTAQYGSPNAFNPAIGGDNVAYSGTNASVGISNLLEYALAGPPSVPNTSILPVVSSSSANTLQISFNRVAPTDVTYIVQASNDLSNPSNWVTIATLASGTTTWSGPATVTETGSGSTRNVTVQDTVLIASQPARYLRLQVTNP